MYDSWIEQNKIRPHRFHNQKLGVLQTSMDQRGSPWKWILTFLKYKSEYHKMLLSKKLKKKKKNGSIVKFSFSFLELWSLNKYCIFCKFVLASARNLNPLKQYIYIHLKDVIMLFQKIVCFIGVWTTFHKILRNKILKKISRNLTKFIKFKRYIFQTLSHR